MSSRRHLRNSAYQTPFPRHLLPYQRPWMVTFNHKSSARFQKLAGLDGADSAREAFGIRRYDAVFIRLGFASIMVRWMPTPDG